MSIYYVDSSVIVTLMFQDKEYEKIRKTLTKAEHIVSANLLEAELFSVGFRESFTVDEIISFVDKISLFFPPDSLEKELTEVLTSSYLRGADAYHLAAALRLDPLKSKLVFLTRDNKQKLAADKLGFRTAI